MALASGISIPLGASITSGAGTAVGLGCGDLAIAGSYTQHGDAGLANMGRLALAGGTFSAGAGVEALSGGVDARDGQFNAGQSTIAMGPAGADCAAAAAAGGLIQGAPTFYNWQVGAAGGSYTVRLPVAQPVTVTNGLTLQNTSLLATAPANAQQSGQPLQPMK